MGLPLGIYWLLMKSRMFLKSQHALDDWYLAPKKDYEVFAEKYPMNGELKMQEAGNRKNERMV